MMLFAQTDWGAWAISTLSLLSTAVLAEWNRRTRAKGEKDKQKEIERANQIQAEADRIREEATQRDYLFKQHQEFVEQLKIERIEDKKVIVAIQREHVNCQLTVATLTERVALLEKFAKKDGV